MCCIVHKTHMSTQPLHHILHGSACQGHHRITSFGMLKDDWKASMSFYLLSPLPINSEAKSLQKQISTSWKMPKSFQCMEWTCIMPRWNDTHTHVILRAQYATRVTTRRLPYSKEVVCVVVRCNNPFGCAGLRGHRHNAGCLCQWPSGLPRSTAHQPFRLAQDSKDFLSAQSFLHQDPSWGGVSARLWSIAW